MWGVGRVILPLYGTHKTPFSRSLLAAAAAAAAAAVILLLLLLPVSPQSLVSLLPLPDVTYLGEI